MNLPSLKKPRLTEQTLLKRPGVHAGKADWLIKILGLSGDALPSIREAVFEMMRESYLAGNGRPQQDISYEVSSRLIKRSALKAGAFGGITATPAALPGIGTLGTVIIGTTADLSYLIRTQIELCYAISAAYGTHFDEEELKKLAQSESNIAHCPASNMKLASGFAKIPQMLEAGVPVSLGCDGGPSNNTYDMIREMRLAALIHKSYVNDPLVVTAEQTIEMATLGGAVAMGIADKVGSLESGKLADMILVDLRGLSFTPASNPVSNLVYSGSGDAVDTVIVNGRLLMHEKRLLTLDEEQVKAKAITHATELIDRSGVGVSPKWPMS